MIDQTTGSTVVMGREIRGMTRDTFPTTSYCRGNETTVGGNAVTSGTTLIGMHLPDTNERSACRCMATDTIGRDGRSGRIYFNLIDVAVIMGIKVRSMTGDTTATITVIDSCVTIAINANDQGTIGVGMTEETGIVVHCADRITCVAIDT